MSPEAQAIKDIISQEAMWILAQSSMVGIGLIGLHKIWKTVAAWASFILNRDIGKHVRVVLNGREAKITHSTLRFIHLRLKDTGNEKIIPMHKWEDQTWEIITNGKSD